MELQILYDLHFNQKQSITKIGRDSGECRNKLGKILVNNGTPPINYQNSIKINQYIFDEIDTEKKAYWLGFIFADGSISQNVFEIQLSEVDVHHLIKFKRFVEWINEIKFKSSTNSARIAFRNKYFTNNLISMGVTENKSLTLSFPSNIPDELIRHFIRGYFDGDGCIHFRKWIKGSRKALINVLGTPQFLNILREYCPIKINKLYRNNNSESTLVYQTVGLKAEQFLYWLYNDANVYLNRKYELFKRIEYDNINRSPE